MSDRERDMSAAELAASLPPLSELVPRMQQLEQELAVLARSHAQLRDALERFAQNVATLALLRNAPPAGADALVPLTPMVYVPGRLAASPRRVLVDVGAGYFVEMGVEAADACYARRVHSVHAQLETLGQVIAERRQAAAAIAQAISIQRSVSA